MEPRQLTRAVAAARIGFGAGLVLAPERLTGRWLGSDSSRTGTQVVARGLGARDIALGIGALTSGEAALRGWLAGAVVADTADFLSTATAGRGVPLSGRIAVGALALGGAALGGIALAGLGRSSS